MLKQITGTTLERYMLLGMGNIFYLDSKCPICSGKVEPWAQKLKSIYNKHNLSELCDSCGSEANSYVNYWGEKRKEDISNLFTFINNGDEPKRVLSAMLNGGYY